MFNFNIDYATITDVQARWDQAIENAQACVSEAIELVEDAERDDVEPDGDELHTLAMNFERAVCCLADIAGHLGDAVDDKPQTWWNTTEGETCWEVIEFDYVIDPAFDDIDVLIEQEDNLGDLAQFQFPTDITVKLD